MKILYALQATGNGHISRAQTLIPLFSKSSQVDVLISGTSYDISLNLPVKFRFTGLSFIFGKDGRVDLLKTIFKINFWQFFKDVRGLDLSQYDLIISDFEPISSWSSIYNNKHCIALSHQFSLLNDKVPKPKRKSWLSMLILKYYAPSSVGYGFHFKEYSKNIYLPIIKSDLIELKPIKKNYFLVYLPSYDDKKIINVLSKIHKTNWVVFSRHANQKYRYGNVKINPVSSKKFNKKLINCRGVLCGAGFETPSEALYLRKKLIVIPMKNQYEQHCNAEALKKLGVPVLYNFNETVVEDLKSWVSSKKIVSVNYSESPQKIVNRVFLDFIKYKSMKTRLIEPGT